MKRFGGVLPAICLLCTLPLHAAMPPVVLNASTLNNCLPESCLVLDDDGNRLVAVTFTNAAYLGGGWLGLLYGNHSREVAVAKYDLEGRLVWWRRGAGPGQEEVTGVATDPTGSVYVTGTFEGTAGFGQTSLVSRGGTDIFVVKYSRDGLQEWAISMGGAANDRSTGITRDPAGGVRLCGAVGGHALLYADPYSWTLNQTIMVDPRVQHPGGAQAFAAAVSSQGIVGAAWTWLSPGRERAVSIAMAADGTMVVALEDMLDSRTSVVIAPPHKPEVRVAAETQCAPHAICISGRSIYLAGTMYGSELRFAGLTVPRRSLNWTTGFLAKVGINGDGLWGREFASEEWAYLLSVNSDPGGGVLLAGLCYGDLFLGETQVPAPGAGDTAGSVVAHLSEDGELDWARFLGSGAQNSAFQAVADRAGNTSVLGSFQNSIHLDDLELSTEGDLWFDPAINLYLAHLRTTPEFAWARRNSGGSAWGAEVATDLNGHRIVVGSFGPPDAMFGDLTVTNADLYDGFVAKYDATGHALWVRTISGPDRQGASSVAVDAGGNCIVVGFFEETVTLGASTFTVTDGPDGLVVKYSPNGDVLWAREIDGTWARNLNRVRVDRGGAVYVAGTFGETIDFGGGTTLTSLGFTDAFLAKYSPSGTLQWVRRGGGGGPASATALAVDGAGNCVLAGSFEEEATFGSFDLAATTIKDVFLVKYDNAGNAKWARRGSGPANDLAAGAAFDAAGNLYVAGSFSERIQFGDLSVESGASVAPFLAKFDRDGAPVWIQAAGSTGAESEATGLAVTRDGTAYVCGLFEREFEAGLWRLQNRGGYDGFLLKFNPGGELQWAKSAGGEGYDVATAVAVDATGTWSLTGQYSEDATFDQQVLHGTPSARFFLTSSTPVLNTRILAPEGSEVGLGAEVNVPLRLAAQGNEAGLSFSLTFDPAVLTYVKCVKGSDWTASATLLLNQSQVAQGRLGLGLTRAGGMPAHGGLEEVVVATFLLAANSQARETTLAFGDQPVARQAVSTTSEDLALDCLPATLKIVRGYEADVVTPFKKITVSDINRIGGFAMGLEAVPDRDTFERADCAPFAVDGSPLLGDDVVNLNDWVQAGRFAVGLDPLTVQGGPSGPFNLLARASRTRNGIGLQDGGADGSRALRILATGWKPGVTNELVVQLDAVGGENAASFSLGFDPGLIRFVDATLGTAAADGTLLLNPAAASQGQLGAVVLLPFGATLPAGTHELLRVRFAVSPFAEGMSSELFFTDFPAARDVADTAGVSLTTEFVNAGLDFRLTALRIGQPVLANGQLHLQTEGVTGKPIVIQTSTDMGTWQNVATNATGIGPISIPWSATDAVRYFRALVP
jgi:hypothetical protein